MRMPALILTVVAAALLVVPASPQDRVNASRKEQTQESAKKVRELKKERLATLKEMANVVTNLVQNGRASPDEAYEARLLVLKAELDAAEKQSDRITLYKNFVDVMKRIEEVAHGRYVNARGTHAAFLKIKARRLEAEIHLEQAKVKSPLQTGGVLEHRKIVVTSPKAKNVVITQKYVGQIHAQRHIKVRALQKGYLEEVPLKEGQTVKRGDLMFKIVPILYKAKWDAELAEARAAELELKNTKKLFDQKVVAIQEVALSEAKLARLRAKVKLAKAELDFTEVRAPFDGVIDRLHEQQGSLITEQDILTTLCDNNLMWVYFNVPQARYLEYMTGPANDEERKIELVLANGKLKRRGKISAIEAQFNDKSGSIPFRADFANPDRLLRHGMTGTVLIHETLKNAIVIPQKATFESAGKRYVYVVDKDDVVHQREIVVQNELEDLFVINRGIGVDDRMVYEGIRQVREGEKVRYEFRPLDQILGHPKNHAE
jgi:membrane fusion protein (multidrug efflux system)